VSEFDWLFTPTVLWSLGALSIVSFVGSLIAIPLILIRLHPNYFDARHPQHWFQDHHPVLRAIALGLKNFIGVVFVLAGLAMLVLPGQGLLTLLIGISLTDFPGKRTLERKIVSQPKVLHAINALRQRFHRPPLIL